MPSPSGTRAYYLYRMDYLRASESHAITTVMTEASGARAFTYPWPGLEDFLDRAGWKSMPLLGYGSLVNRASAAKSLTATRRTPAVAFGAKRVFDYPIAAGTTRYGPPADPYALAALNVHVTHNIEHIVNGVLIDISRRDLPALRARELDYALQPVACVWWPDRLDKPFIAYILERREKLATKNPLGPGIRPHHEYYRVCRQGAESIDTDFLSLWLDTTYLADGETLVREWERTVPGLSSA